MLSVLRSHINMDADPHLLTFDILPALIPLIYSDLLHATADSRRARRDRVQIDTNALQPFDEHIQRNQRRIRHRTLQERLSFCCVFQRKNCPAGWI